MGGWYAGSWKGVRDLLGSKRVLCLPRSPAHERLGNHPCAGRQPGAWQGELLLLLLEAGCERILRWPQPTPHQQSGDWPSAGRQPGAWQGELLLLLLEAGCERIRCWLRLSHRRIGGWPSAGRQPGASEPAVGGGQTPQERSWSGPLQMLMENGCVWGRRCPSPPVC